MRRGYPSPTRRSRAGMREFLKYAAFLALALVWSEPVPAQSFPLSPADVADSAALTRSMPRLAQQVLAGYQETDSLKLLDNLFRLQLVAGHYQDALKSLAALQASRRAAPPRDRA